MSTALEALMAELLTEFRGELPQRCNDLEDAVLALENKQPGAFDELFRQVHSLKGTGGGVGMPIVTTICHQLESFMGEAKQRFDRKAASTALSYIDLLRRTATGEGQESAGIADIEQALEQMRIAGLSGRASILVVDPSIALRILVQREFAGPSVQLHILKTGMEALQRMLHEPFDLLIISRELPDLNAIAVVAALREARCSNSAIPVVLVSSNPAPVPTHLEFLATVRRDVHLVPELTRHIGDVASKLRET